MISGQIFQFNTNQIEVFNYVSMIEAILRTKMLTRLSKVLRMKNNFF